MHACVCVCMCVEGGVCVSLSHSKTISPCSPGWPGTRVCCPQMLSCLSHPNTGIPMQHCFLVQFLCPSGYNNGQAHSTPICPELKCSEFSNTSSSICQALGSMVVTAEHPTSPCRPLVVSTAPHREPLCSLQPPWVCFVFSVDSFVDKLCCLRLSRGLLGGQ